MARPKKTMQTVGKKVFLPLDLVTKVDLYLYSELESRVPLGAWQRYLTALILKDLQEKNL